MEEMRKESKSIELSNQKSGTAGFLLLDRHKNDANRFDLWYFIA